MLHRVGKRAVDGVCLFIVCLVVNPEKIHIGDADRRFQIAECPRLDEVFLRFFVRFFGLYASERTFKIHLRHLAVCRGMVDPAIELPGFFGVRGSAFAQTDAVGCFHFGVGIAVLPLQFKPVVRLVVKAFVHRAQQHAVGDFLLGGVAFNVFAVILVKREDLVEHFCQRVCVEVGVVDREAGAVFQHDFQRLVFDVKALDISEVNGYLAFKRGVGIHAPQSYQNARCAGAQKACVGEKIAKFLLRVMGVFVARAFEQRCRDLIADIFSAGGAYPVGVAVQDAVHIVLKAVFGGVGILSCIFGVTFRKRFGVAQKTVKRGFVEVYHSDVICEIISHINKKMTLAVAAFLVGKAH